MSEAAQVYLNSNEHLRANTEVETRDDRFGNWIRETYPIHEYERSAPIMHKIRAVKDPLEIKLIQKACDLTESAFRKILKTIKPGEMEYEIEADIIHEFIKNRSRGFAYTPIIASGESACVLHYIENNKPELGEDLVLMDLGAEYHGYTADVTRIF